MGVICKCCGRDINSVQANCFDREGSDSWVDFKIEETPGTAVLISVPSNWVGNGLDEEEQMECIRCQHCKKFPFQDSIDTYERIEIVAWRTDRFDPANERILWGEMNDATN